MSPEELARWEAERREHNRLELERIKRQRQEREAEALKKRAEKERAILDREKESLGDWEEKERIFHLSQAYQKCYLRIREGRGRILHVLALVTLRISLLQDKEHFNNEVLLLQESDVPSRICKRLDSTQLDELLAELNDAFLAYERDREILRFWDALFAYANELKAANKRSISTLAPVKEDINAIFAGKSHAKLLELQQGIQKKLATQTDIDTDYWTDLLNELRPLLLQTKLDETYEELRRQLVKASEQANCEIKTFSFSDFDRGNVIFTKIQKAHEPIEEPKQQEDATFNDRKRLNWDSSPTALALFEAEKTRSVGKDELPFNVEAEDISRQTAWTQKYPQIKPRKPRFFNRVRMNYEWNRYNQTHYDTSNPPPKIVQGFRFNVFYPDLNDPSVTPTYRREADPNSPDNEIVRFSAGPPYEDIVFRIPKEEWDMSSRHGFKCVFERGALRLHFWFRSQRYKR